MLTNNYRKKARATETTPSVSDFSFDFIDSSIVQHRDLLASRNEHFDT